MQAVPDEAPPINQHVQEFRKRSNDAEAAKIEFERVFANWIECHVKWKKYAPKKN